MGDRELWPPRSWPRAWEDSGAGTTLWGFVVAVPALIAGTVVGTTQQPDPVRILWGIVTSLGVGIVIAAAIMVFRYICPRLTPVDRALRWMQGQQVECGLLDKPNLAQVLYHLHLGFEEGITEKKWLAQVSAVMPPADEQIAAMEKGDGKWARDYSRSKRLPKDLLLELCSRRILERHPPGHDEPRPQPVYRLREEGREAIRKIGDNLPFFDLTQ